MKLKFIIILLLFTTIIYSQTYYFYSENQSIVKNTEKIYDYKNKFIIEIYITPIINSGTIKINKKETFFEIINIIDTKDFISYEINENNFNFLLMFYKKLPIITIINEKKEQIYCYILKFKTLK